MAGRWLTFHEVKDCFDEQIILHGPNAFGPNYGFAQLYSGPPADTILSAIIGITETNQDKAKRQASTDNAILFDNTPIGEFSAAFKKIGLYRYFLLQPHGSYKARLDDADNIMRHVSQKFIESLWGKVSTAVCGAGSDRIFYDTEIPTMAFIVPELIRNLLKSKDIETVNNVSIADIRTVCQRTDYDAAFDLICRGELNLAFRKAMDTGEARLFKDFLERSEFYMVERELTLTAAGKSVPSLFGMTAVERADWRRDQIQKFLIGKLGKILEDLDAALPSTPSPPVFVSRADAKRSGPR